MKSARRKILPGNRLPTDVIITSCCVTCSVNQTGMSRVAYISIETFGILRICTNKDYLKIKFIYLQIILLPFLFN